MLQPDTVSATLTSLEIAVMHVSSEPSTFQLVKLVVVIPKDLLTLLVIKMEFVLAKIITLEINVKIVLQNITTLPTPAIPANVMKMVQLIKIVMPMENVRVKKMLLETNVTLSYLAIMTLMIPKNVTVTWKDLRMKLVMIKEDVIVAVMSKETNVTNATQNIGDSQHVMPVCVMNMVLLMMNAMQQLANVHVKKISPMTNAVNVLKVSSDFQIAKVVLAMLRDQKLLLVILLENVHANLMLLELIVTSVLKDTLASQIVKLANVTWMDPKEKIVLTMANVLVRNTLVDLIVMNARLVTA
jgi:hypothetical protein